MQCFVLALCFTTIPIETMPTMPLWKQSTPSFQDPKEMLPPSGAILPIASVQGIAPSLPLPLCLSVGLSVSQWDFHSNYVVFPLNHFSLFAFYYTYLHLKKSLLGYLGGLVG